MSGWTKDNRTHVSNILGEAFERNNKSAFPPYARGAAFEGWEHKETGRILVFRRLKGVTSIVAVWPGSRAVASHVTKERAQRVMAAMAHLWSSAARMIDVTSARADLITALTAQDGIDG